MSTLQKSSAAVVLTILSLVAMLTASACSFDPEGLAHPAHNTTNNTNNTSATNNVNNTNNTNTTSSPCGDGVIEGGEGCDDQNTTSGDGCDSACVVEEGYACQGAPSSCTPVCGDGHVIAPEACDDGNGDAADGCDMCAVVAGWTCAGEPSTCWPEDWYDPTFAKRRRITVDGGMVSEDLAEFPMLVHIYQDASVDAVSGAHEFLFTLDDGVTPLSHEIQLFEPGGEGLLAWVKVPNLWATHNTVIYLYYGNPGAFSIEDAAGVWSANYEAVLHLDEEGGGVDGEYADATGNGYDATGGGAVGSGAAERTPQKSQGLFGSAQYFPGSSQDPSCAIHLPQMNDSGWTALTAQVWMFPQDTGDQRVFGKSFGNGSDTVVWLMGKTDRPKYRVRTVSSSVNVTNGAPFQLNSWVHYVLVWSNTGVVSVYGNGVLLHSTPLPGGSLYVDNTEPIIGNSPLYPGDDRPFLGKIQEVRVSRVVRSPAWIMAEYQNQSNPQLFYTLDAEEVLSGF